MKRRAREIPELLRELARWKARADGGLPIALPVVTLWLRSGARASGLVADMGEGSTVLLLQLPEDRRQEPFDALHVPLAAVEAVTVHDDLRAGQARPDVRGPRSMLELTRRLESMEEGMRVELIVESKDAGEDTLLAIEALAVTAKHALQQITAEAGGTVALQRITVIQLEIGNVHARMDGSMLVLTTPVELLGWPTVDDLVAKIEAAL
jgi:hypothetical protein